MGQWRYSYVAEKLSAALRVAQRVRSLAMGQNNSAIMIGACQALVSTLYYLGEFETARQYAALAAREMTSLGQVNGVGGNLKRPSSSYSSRIQDGHAWISQPDLLGGELLVL